MPRVRPPRHIGVSNFSPARLEALAAAARHAPEFNQVECHPFLSQRELLETCARLNVVLTAYSPLGSGKEKAADAPDIFTDPTLGRIAAAHGITPAQAALAWAVTRGSVAIPKSVHADRQRENLDAARITLSPEEVREIDALDRGFRHIDGAFWSESGSPYTPDWIWRRGDLS